MSPAIASNAWMGRIDAWFEILIAVEILSERGLGAHRLCQDPRWARAAGNTHTTTEKLTDTPPYGRWPGAENTQKGP